MSSFNVVGGVVAGGGGGVVTEIFSAQSMSRSNINPRIELAVIERLASLNKIPTQDTNCA